MLLLVFCIFPNKGAQRARDSSRKPLRCCTKKGRHFLTIRSIFQSILWTKAGVLNGRHDWRRLHQQMRVFAVFGVFLQTLQCSLAYKLRDQRRINSGHFQAISPGDQHQWTFRRRRNRGCDYVPVQTAGDELAQLLNAYRIRARMIEHHDGAVFDVVQPSLDRNVGVFAVARPNGAVVAAGRRRAMRIL